MMRILVCNDDGVHHPGLHALVRALQPLGEVIVCAPDRNRSGVGAALTLHDPVRVRQVAFIVPGVTAYAVEGTPGDAVIMGLRRMVGGPVDLVVTGVNPGHNVSQDLLVSGTVGGALQAYLNGFPALAVSSAVIEDVVSPVLAKVTREVAAGLFRAHRGSAALVNMNFPKFADPGAETALQAGVRGARASIPSMRLVDDQVEPDTTGRDHFWILRRAAGPANPTPEAGSDIRVLRDGMISLVSLSWDLRPAEGALLQPLVEAAQEALELEKRPARIATATTA